MSAVKASRLQSETASLVKDGRCHDIHESDVGKQEPVPGKAINTGRPGS